MIGYMQHTGTGIILISTLEVKTGIYSHIGSRNLDILIVRDVHSGGIVHLIISTRCDRKTGYGTFSMVEHGIDIRREYALIVIIHRYGRIRPPQKGLRYFGTVVKYSFDFKKSMSGTKCKTCHSLLMKHTFHFIYPYRDASVGIFLNSRIHGHISTGAMMLRPVKFDTTRNPRSCKSHQSRLYHMIIINKMTLSDFIIGHLHTSTQFRQNHHFDIFVFDKNSIVFLIHLFIGH